MREGDYVEYLINEIDENKKFDSLLDTYMKILNQNKNKSQSIMIIVPNNNTKLKYERNVNLDYSEEININTYISFLKKELVKYWPIVMENCNLIKKSFISPVFIQNSLTEYIITKEVERKRNLEGYFEDLTGTNRSIAKSIINNINKASLNLIEFSSIWEKVYLSKKNRDKLLRFSYTQMDEIINYYIDLLLENSMLDNSLSVYLYNNYLLNDRRYIEGFKRQIKYLIIESLESSSVAECEFIRSVSTYLDDTYIYFNKKRDYSVFNNVDMEYIQKNIIMDIEKDLENNIVNIESLNSNKYTNVQIEDIYLLPAKIYLNQSSQLYSEMVGEVCDKVLNLVNNGVNPRDIAVISPINNNILDYSLDNTLSKNNIKVFNTKKDGKVIDYPYANALIVAACIFYEYLEFVREEDYINFIETILSANRIQAYKIFKNKDNFKDETELNTENSIEDFQNGIENLKDLDCKSKLEEKIIEYKKILKYIKEKRNDNLKIDEFLMQFYIDKMLNLTDGRDNFIICKKIIQESDTFTENISLLGLDKKNEKEKIFIEALKSTINDFYTTRELEDSKEENSIVITTPYSYISTNMKRPIQIWIDIGSNAWNMKIEKDISNMIVLRKSFEEKRIYTDDVEDYYKKYYLYNTIYNLLIKSKEVYAYKSEYTVNGYMQESMLYGLLLKIL